MQRYVTLDHRCRRISVFDFPPEKDTMKFFTRNPARAIPALG
jgi:hypothetical protein